MPMHNIQWMNYCAYQILGAAAQYGMYVEQGCLVLQWFSAIRGTSVHISDKFRQPCLKKLNRGAIPIGGPD